MSDSVETAPTLTEELNYVRQLAIDLNNVLKQQREALKDTGYRLPPGTTSTLDDVSRRLESISRHVKLVEHERDQYQALADTASLINSSLDLEQVLNEVMDTLINLAGAERGYLMLRNEITGDFEFRIARNVDRETIDSSGFEISRSIVKRVADSGEGVVTTNAQEDPRFQDSASIAGFNLLSIMCVPLTAKGFVTGVIYTDNKIQASLFTEATLALLMAFANQAAVAIENARLFERVRASLQEISEMKNLQDNIFASIASGVITTDDEDRVTLLNHSARNILALNDEDPQGRNLYDIVPLKGSRFRNIVKETLEYDQQITAVEFEANVKDRGKVSLSMNFSPLKDGYAHTQGVAIVMDDQTEVKRREAQITGVRRYLPEEVVDGIREATELKLGGTRRDISILFADVRGYSTLAEYTDPEVLVHIINGYWTIAAAAIHEQFGVIDKFIGDAVMAMYNTPLRPQGDHAIRAVRSAARMMEDIRSFNTKQREQDRVSFGIGVHTGEAVVGNVGSPDRLDYTAMGDSVNLAKRLQEEARPMQILISDETYQFVADFVDVIELEPIKVKGRTQMTQIYELVGVR